MLKHSNLWDDSEGPSKQPIVSPVNGFEVLNLVLGPLNFPGKPCLLFPRRDFTENAAEMRWIWKTERMGKRGKKRRCFIESR